jgi:probable rRNA maturation factor
MTRSPALQLDVQYESKASELPNRRQLQQWVLAVLTAVGRVQPTELSLRIVDRAEGARLNQTWRQKTGATNVLSFPFENPPGLNLPLLGDIVICAPVVAEEAETQQKPITAHWAHLVIHGVLHLLGFDHTTEAEAQDMERLEIDILTTLHYPNPY